MAKTKLEIDGMSCQHCVKTVTDALTTLEGVQRVKVNLRKGEAVVRYDASYITDANLVAAITAVGFEAVTKTEPLALRLIGGILITLLSITGCSDMPYTGSMLTAEDVDRYITIVEDSACLLSGHESVCITLIPETQDESRPIIHIHPRKLIYVFYHEGVQIMQAEMVMDTTEIMQQIRGPREDDQPPSREDGVRDDSSDDDRDGTINGGGDTQQPGDGSTQKPDDGTQQPGDGSTQKPDDGTQQPGDGSTQKPDGGDTQQPGDGSTPRSDDGNGGTQQPPPLPSYGGNQNGSGNNGQGNNGQGNNGQGNNGQGNNGGSDGNGSNNGNGGNGGTDENGGTNGNGGNGDTPPGNNIRRSSNVGDSDLSTHYYYHTKQPITGDGWLIQIYYPENYNGPRKLREDPEGYGFTVTLSGTEARIRNFSQTAGGCNDYNKDGKYDKPCNRVIDPNNPSTYSVQMYIQTTETTLSITVNWKPPYAHLTKTYTLNAAVNIAESTLDHTSQMDN